MLESDNHNESDIIYHNLEDEARLDSKAAVDVEENDDEIENENDTEVSDEMVFDEPAGRCQVRSDIYSQISVISFNGYEYFKCNTLSKVVQT